VTKYKPPYCPHCKEPLDKVWETEYDTYIFNYNTGTYEREDWGDMTIKCTKCEYSVIVLFPDGACNFMSRVRVDT